MPTPLSPTEPNWPQHPAAEWNGPLRQCGAPLMNFDELNLAPAIVQAVREQGYETPTPIQAQAIPAVLAGQDLLAGAQTGTKTVHQFEKCRLRLQRTRSYASSIKLAICICDFSQMLTSCA